jgi:hypothetical protein
MCAWNAVAPDGSKSVKQNNTILGGNTTYTETTLNNDHYWNIGANEDGFHKQVQAPKLAADLTLSTGMDGGIYFKEINSRVEGFYRNASGIYQFIPSFLSGTFTPGTSHTTITEVPNNTYGNIYMFIQDGSNSGVTGFFKAAGGVCQSYSQQLIISGSASKVLEFKNDNGALTIRAKLAASGIAGTYQYRIVYWAM